MNIYGHDYTCVHGEPPDDCEKCADEELHRSQLRMAERLAAAYGDRLRYLYQENSGSCSKPRNAGVKIASGELIAFIDADDIMAPVRIAREVAFLTAHPDVWLVFTNYCDFEGDRVSELGHFESCDQLSRLLSRQ